MNEHASDVALVDKGDLGLREQQRVGLSAWMRGKKGDDHRREAVAKLVNPRLLGNESPNGLGLDGCL